MNQNSHGISRLKIFLLNAENLFLLFDHELSEADLQKNELAWQKLSTTVFDNKSLRKTKMLADEILLADPDLVLLTEVGGEESLKNFNQFFLNSKFSCALIEGNSDRSIDVGFLINKNLPTNFEIMSNKDRLLNFLYPHERQFQDAQKAAGKTPTGPLSHKFSRDVAELYLFGNSRNNPNLIVLLTHLKSPLDPERIDPNGTDRREAELKSLIEIYNEVRIKFPKTTILVAGDFNGNASKLNTDREFKDLYDKSDLIDVLEIAQIPQIERNTFYHVRGPGKVEGRQIDYTFISEAHKDKVIVNSVQVLRFKNELGSRPLAPTSLDEKLNQPSDHYPIIFEIDLSK